MFCSRCGFKLNDNSRFCNNCGAKVLLQQADLSSVDATKTLSRKNALICEMCNSSDIYKENGYYVCGSCGIRYSLEEAKKLVIRITDSSVKIDESSKASNYIKLSYNEIDAGNAQGALDYCNKALEINNSYLEAWYNKTIAFAMLSNHSGVISSFNRAIDVFPKKKEEIPSFPYPADSIHDLDSFEIMLAIRLTAKYLENYYEIIRSIECDVFRQIGKTNDILEILCSYVKVHEYLFQKGIPNNFFREDDVASFYYSVLQTIYLKYYNQSIDVYAIILDRIEQDGDALHPLFLGLINTCINTAAIGMCFYRCVLMEKNKEDSIRIARLMCRVLGSLCNDLNRQKYESIFIAMDKTEDYNMLLSRYKEFSDIIKKNA